MSLISEFGRQRQVGHIYLLLFSVWLKYVFQGIFMVWQCNQKQSTEKLTSKHSLCSVTHSSKKKNQLSRLCWCTPLIPALGRQRQANLWVRGQPGLRVSSRRVRATGRNLVSKKPKPKTTTTNNNNKLSIWHWFWSLDVLWVDFSYLSTSLTTLS